MLPNRLLLVVTLPWLAAALVVLLALRQRDTSLRWDWGLFGSGAICFSIGCLARTSAMVAGASRDGSSGPGTPPRS
ncbi:hypothetical protein VB716_14535 [Synechococcus sp. CCY9201]|jgi:hypothetical protein|uniref:hypothetical protein n=1 Tax=unclassified Synechococcus TaxID=2626047 RepID=UPI0018CEDD89|nr:MULTISPECIES: hypothetical protein [unclassified Synechococcus]MEA5422774.1 hypothetical protein [Synechococcus sp. CCY9202]MEA5475436.1 hypothetical protein [Synechococcus sp. CCY9201]QPN59882.1 hypothetical protein H8F24_18455 [Synechococcus sp. CBW1002]QPN66681.1 hypothetical protein H8F26_18565 [Synechococcus sp. CBW1006]